MATTGHGLPDEVKRFIQQGWLTEGHLREISSIFIVECLSRWVTTERAQLEALR